MKALGSTYASPVYILALGIREDLTDRPIYSVNGFKGVLLTFSRTGCLNARYDYTLRVGLLQAVSYISVASAIIDIRRPIRCRPNISF